MESNHCFYCSAPSQPRPLQPLQSCCKYPGAAHAHHGVICCTQWSQKTLEEPWLLTLGFIHAAGPASITLFLIPQESNQRKTPTAVTVAAPRVATDAEALLFISVNKRPCKLGMSDIIARLRYKKLVSKNLGIRGTH